jgi:hypothetical protein
MANVKISELTSASTALAGTEVLPIVQSGATVKVSVANLTAGRSVAASAVVSATIGAASSAALNLQSNGATNAILDTSGNLGVGVTPVAGGGVLQLKSGITFPATQVASSNVNTLDDYEEGTWTPVPTNITVVSGTPVYTGKYTKIGNIVQAYFEMSGGNITITGSISNLSLPFTAPTVDSTGGYTNGATGTFVGGLLAYGTVMIITTSVTSTSLTGSLVYRVA